MNSHSHPNSPYQQPHSLAFERARMARKRAARIARRQQQEADQRHRAQLERERQRRQLQQFEYELQLSEEHHRRIAEAS